MKFSSVGEAIEHIKKGKFVIVVDSEERENEGDLIMAAEKVTPQAVAFMAKKASGLICVPLTQERLNKLRIPLMWYKNESKFGTGFTVSVSARHGITTGISAFDRAKTIQTLVDPQASWNDIVMPGHVFPLRTLPGGVLARAGHTEASVELALLAGFSPAGVICEIMNDDGSMARMSQLLDFAKAFCLPILRIPDLVDYRKKQHKDRGNTSVLENNGRDNLTKVSQTSLPTSYGQFRLTVFEEADGTTQLALSYGNLPFGQPVLIRIHSACLTGDVFSSQRCDCGWQMQEALRQIKKKGQGLLLYLNQEGRGVGLIHKLRAYALQDKGLDTVEANRHLGFPADARQYHVAASILRSFLVSSIRLLTNNPDKITTLEDFGIHVVERIPLKAPIGKDRKDYLFTKKTKLGHLL